MVNDLGGHPAVSPLLAKSSATTIASPHHVNATLLSAAPAALRDEAAKTIFTARQFEPIDRRGYAIDPDAFSLKVAVASIAGIGLSASAIRRGMRMTVAQPGAGNVTIGLRRRGAVSVVSPVRAESGDRASTVGVLYREREGLQVNTSDDHFGLAIELPYGRIQAVLARLIERPVGRDIVLAPEIRWDTPGGATLLRLITHIEQELCIDGSLVTTPTVAPAIEEPLIRTLLTAQPSNFSHLLERPAKEAASAALLKARDFMAAHATEPLTLDRVAAEAGCALCRRRSATRSAAPRWRNCGGSGPISPIRNCKAPMRPSARSTCGVVVGGEGQSGGDQQEGGGSGSFVVINGDNAILVAGGGGGGGGDANTAGGPGQASTSGQGGVPFGTPTPAGGAAFGGAGGVGYSGANGGFGGGGAGLAAGGGGGGVGGGGGGGSYVTVAAVPGSVTETAGGYGGLNGLVAIVPLCFLAATRIATPSGPRAIEHLRPGDAVITADGSVAPVAWTGRNRVTAATPLDRALHHPVCIRRDAIAPGVPGRDLRVTGDHAIFVDGLLTPARLLVNGGSIRAEPDLVDYTYYHLELPRHALLLAEGLPAESHLDFGTRRAMEGEGTPVLTTALAVEDAYQAHGVAPLCLDAALIEPVWRRLTARSTALGLTPPALPAPRRDATPHLIARGRRIAPVHAQGDRLVFALPPGTRQVRLVSDTHRPSDARPWLDDRRRLGVAVARLTASDADQVIDLPLDGAALGAG